MTTLNLAVTAGNEDAYENDAGGSFSNNNDRLLVRSSTTASSRFNSGMVFPNATIPAGATIDSCVWRPYAKTSGADDIAADIYFNDVDNAADFATDADVTTRIASAATSASVAWDEDALDSPPVYASSPDLKVPCQEVIDRGGWASGQDLCVLAKGRDQATAKNFEGAGYEYTGSTESLLDIDYTAGITLSATPAVLKLAGVAPAASGESKAEVAVPPSVLDLDIKAAALALGTVTLAVPVATVKLVAVTPVVQAITTLAVTPAALKLVGVTPGISVSAITVAAPVAVVNVVGVAPSITVPPVTLAVAPAVLGLQGVTPIVIANVSLAATPAILKLVGVTPATSVGAISLAVTPAVLKLQGIAPTITAGVTLSATPSVLNLVAVNPAVQVSGVTVTTPIAVVRILGVAPDVQAGAALLVTPAILKMLAVVPGVTVSAITIPVTPSVARLIAIAPIIPGVGGFRERGIGRGIAQGEARGV